jgi:2-polyprenyl-3-methyl-5-hydroxy-6-metoxy-1,4-benzoquinol methylase
MGKSTPRPHCAVCACPLEGRERVSLDGIRLVACGTCGSWTLLPRPSVERQNALHSDSSYFEHPYFRERRKAVVAISRRCRLAFERLARAIDIGSLERSRMLDVGCDTGAFMQIAHDLYGVDPIGIDVSEAAVAEVKKRGIEAFATDLEHAPSELSDFNIITAIDLIEHVVDPRSFLMSAYRRLRPGGVIYLETPNAQSVIYNVGAAVCGVTSARPRTVFERLFPEQHVQYFTARSLSSLAQACGLELVWLDSRMLPISDVATVLPVRLALGGMQVVDSIRRTSVLLCAVLRRPTLTQSQRDMATSVSLG